MTCNVDGLKVGDKIYLEFTNLHFMNSSTLSYYYLLNNKSMAVSSAIGTFLYDSNLYKHYIKPGEKISYSDNMDMYVNEFEIYAECTQDNTLSICVDYTEDFAAEIFFKIDIFQTATEIYVER